MSLAIPPKTAADYNRDREAYQAKLRATTTELIRSVKHGERPLPDAAELFALIKSLDGMIGYIDSRLTDTQQELAWALLHIEDGEEADAMAARLDPRAAHIHSLSRLRERYSVTLTLEELNMLNDKLVGGMRSKKLWRHRDFQCVVRYGDGMQLWRANLASVSRHHVWVLLIFSPTNRRVVTFKPRDHVLLKSGQVIHAEPPES